MPVNPSVWGAVSYLFNCTLQKMLNLELKKLKIKIRHSLHLLLNLHGIWLFVLCFLFQQKYVVVAAAMTTTIAATTPITISITIVCDSLSFEESDPCLPPVGACGDGAQSLSGRGAQCCLDSVKPCSSHSGTSSSWSSKQQWEHFWQLWVPSFLLK